MRSRMWLSALALSVGLCSASAFADVTGKVTFDGTPPKPKAINMNAVPDCAKQHTDPVYEENWVVGENGEVKNCVVYIKDGAKLVGQAKNEPVILDQKGCIYSPHVVVAMVGQELKARNSDTFLHNVHGLAKDNQEFNFPQQQQGQENKINGTNAVETYMIKCDVHPWMKAWVVVLDHPFFAVTGDEGTFKIPGLKDGKYTLICWHEPALVQEKEIEVKNGSASVDFKVAPRKKTAAAETVKEAKAVLAAVSAPAADSECEFCAKDAEIVVKADAKGGQVQTAAK